MEKITPLLQLEDTKQTKKLLTAGAIGGPLFIVLALVQALTREGFDPVKHPASMLSLGDLGWIQIANFVLAGLLFILCAAGLKRALQAGPGGTWTPILVGIFGIALIIGGVFVADPGLGYPPGAPDGMAETFSWHGAIHAFAPLGFVALIVSFFVFGRRFARSGQRGWMWASIVIGILTLLLTSPLMYGGNLATPNFTGLWAGTVLGFGFISVLAIQVKAGLDAGEA